MGPFPRILRILDRLRQDPIGATLVSLAHDSAVYLAGGILIGLGNIILVPLYTRCLQPREFGVYALVDVTVLLFVTVTALKLDVSYLKWFAEVNPFRQGELLGSTLIAGFVTSVLGGLVLFLLAASRPGELWLSTVTSSFAWMLLPIVVFENLQALILTDLRARRRSFSYSAAAVVRLSVMFVASYYLLVFRHSGLPGLFLGRLVGDAAAVIFLGLVAVRKVLLKISSSLLKPMLRFGLPLVWSVFTVMLQDAAGRYFLSRYGTLEQVGLLGAAIKIGAVFQMLVNVPFGVAWGGILFQIVKERDAQIIYSKILGYVYVLALGIALVLTIFGPTLFRVFTAPAYYPAVVVLPLVLLVRAMNVVEQPSATGIYLSGRTGIFAVIYTVALAVNLVLLRVLVPKYGVLGVGWAWFVGSALVPIADLLFGQKIYRLTLSPKLMFLPLLPWLFVIGWLPEAAGGRVMNQFVIECAVSFIVVLFTGALLVYDIRGLRRQLKSRDGSLAWGTLSQ